MSASAGQPRRRPSSAGEACRCSTLVMDQLGWKVSIEVRLLIGSDVCNILATYVDFM